MRSAQVYRALDQIPNRFALCMQVSRGVHLAHTTGQSMESSVSTALAGIDSKDVSRGSNAPIPVLVARVLPLPVRRPVIVTAT